MKLDIPGNTAQEEEVPSPSIKRKINRGFTKELGFVLNEDQKKEERKINRARNKEDKKTKSIIKAENILDINIYNCSLVLPYRRSLF